MKVLGIYHSADLDGKCSGAIIRRRYPAAKLIGIDRGEPVPWDAIEDADRVILSDYSFTLEEMLKIDEMVDFIWYDHHKSAIKDMEGHIFCGIQLTTQAGCELTWLGLFGPRIPRVVESLGSYDSWRWVNESPSVQERILNTQYGMMLNHWDPEEYMWQHLLDDDNDEQLHQIIVAGRTIRRFQAQTMKGINTTGRVISWEGAVWFVVNTHMTSSNNYAAYVEAMDEVIHGVIAFHRRPNGWKYSMRQMDKNLDVSLIAKAYGGGGHAGAASFYSAELIEAFA